MFVYKNFITSIDFSKIYFYSLLFFAFMMPLAKASNSLFPFLMIFLLILQGNYKEHFKILKKETIFITMVAFISLMSVSILWTDNLKWGFDDLRHFLSWIAIFAIALNLKIEQIYKIITAFIFGMFISEVLAYGMFFEFWEIRGHGKEYPSPFMSHETYGFYLAFTATILFNRILVDRYRLKEKILYTLFFISIMGNLFINTGRMGQLVFIIGVFTTVIIHYKFSFKSIILSSVIVSVIFVSAFNLSNHFKSRVILAQQDITKALNHNYNTSWGNRVVYWLIAFESIKSNPLIGVGVGDYGTAIANIFEKESYGVPLKRQGEMARNHFHNQYLNVAVQIGIIGLVLLLVVYFNYFKMNIKEKEIKELSMFFILMFAAAGFSSLYFGRSYGTSIFILFTGLFIAGLLNKEDHDISSKVSL
ncbi:MAG TPA: O-antigen ligase family protein [Sulfurimonas sp.]|nr:O-antigen ligase family protein [Sulfurimonas sp.]